MASSFPSYESLFQIETSYKGKNLSFKIVSEYDQEIPQSQTADKPMAS